MAPQVRNRTVLRGIVGFLLVYAGVITLVTMANNGWYPILSFGFCGSLTDFTDGPVPAVCISFWGYWVRAAVHLPYAVGAGSLSAAVVAGHRYRSS